MTWKRRNRSTANRAASRDVSARRFDSPEGTPAPTIPQPLLPPPGLDPGAHPIIGAHFYGIEPDGDGSWQHVGTAADRVVAALRFQRQVKRLHELGPRPVGELLKELVEQSGEGDFMEARLAAFAALDPEVVHALGGDQFPPTLTVVQP